MSGFETRSDTSWSSICNGEDNDSFRISKLALPTSVSSAKPTIHAQRNHFSGKRSVCRTLNVNVWPCVTQLPMLRESREPPCHPQHFSLGRYGAGAPRGGREDLGEPREPAARHPLVHESRRCSRDTHAALLKGPSPLGEPAGRGFRPPKGPFPKLHGQTK